METPKHYEAKITPAEYIHANDLDFFRGNVVKYVSRDKRKNGAEDIRKAIWYCERLLKEIGDERTE